MTQTSQKNILSDRVWEIKERKFPDLVDQLLYNRRVIDEKGSRTAVDDFFTGKFEDVLCDPYLLPDMKKAVSRIQTAKEKNETVGIFADYDADGVPAAALLAKTFELLRIKYVVYIPTRDTGYGLNQAGLDYLADKGASVIISADLGIRNVSEAQYCQSRDLDLIITDHHLPGDEVPDALAVVNPKIKSSQYPFPELCGCGVVYKFIEALAKVFPQITESYLKWNLDLVGISTIADMVPLFGENRILTKYGLTVLQKTKNVGLKALYKAAGIKADDVNPYTVGFQIAPRLNTPGRIDHATKSFELLTTTDESRAAEISLWLNEQNTRRQEMMEKVVTEAVAQIEAADWQAQKVLLVSGAWERGVLGPPASRLVEKYHRPVIVFAKEAGEYIGSARSVEGVHILKLLESVAPDLLKYGGHAGAAGLAVKKSHFNIFKSHLEKSAEKSISSDLLVSKIKVDAEVKLAELTHKFHQMLDKFEPFGLGNPRPVFVARGVEFKYARCVGSDKKHLSAVIEIGGSRFKVIYFNCGYSDIIMANHTKYDIAFTFNIDNWNDQNQLSLSVVDMKTSDAD